MAAPLEAFPVVVEIPVAWGDMDAFAHVNNTVYLRWFESARIAYFERIDALGVKDATGIGPILAATSCRFRIPLTHPDTVLAGARVGADSLGTDRFTMAYAVWSRGHGKLAAEGDGRIVTFDYGAGTKAPLPDVLRQRILALG